MPIRISDPFTPDKPITNPELFSGRKDQIDVIIDSLFQTSNNNSRHTIVTGKRGIGKSSLLHQTQRLSKGDNSLTERFDLDLGVEEFNFVSAWHDATHDESCEDVSIALLQDLQGWLGSAMSGLEITLNIGSIVEIKEKEEDEKTISSLVRRFITEIRKITSRMGDNTDGLLIFIDELDRLDVNSDVGSFLRLATERLAKEEINNVAFFCAGIKGAIQELQKDHKSIVRNFRDIPLPKLEENEIKNLLDKGLSMVSLSTEPSVYPEVRKLSDGFPESVHLIGSEIIKVISNDCDSREQFENTEVDLDILGRAKSELISSELRNKLEEELKAAGEGKYQLILEAMANFDDQVVPLSYIEEEIGYEQSQFSSNMGTLIDREILERESIGNYRFRYPFLREYIKEFGIMDSLVDDD